MKRIRGSIFAWAAVLCGVWVGGGGRFFGAPQPVKQFDPAAWGGDHVGKPVPEYITGDECLFCHRNDVGPSWPKNRHHLTIREAEPDTPAVAALKQAPGPKDKAAEVKLVLGGSHRVRFLKPAQGFGKLDLLSTGWAPAQSGEPAKLVASEQTHWDSKAFADGCAGCHATGVDGKTGAFTTVSLDCYACHGDVNLKHTKDTAQIYLAKKRQDPARVVTSICAQCHVRTAKSRSTGLPYANNFVAGDNLFRDFQVDWSPDKIKSLNAGDRHVVDNVRDVVILGKEDVTCLTCHDVHQQSSKKHRLVAQGDNCLHCHNPTGSKKIRNGYEVHSSTCGY
jgi:hypothetical protein